MVQFANLPSKSEDSDSENAVKMTSSNSSDQEVPNGSSSRGGGTEEGHSKKRKRKQKSEKGGKFNGSHSKRRHSVSKPARDPRDEASPVRPQKEIAGTRSPSPVIDFDGLSRPSMCLLLFSQMEYLSGTLLICFRFGYQRKERGDSRAGPSQASEVGWRRPNDPRMCW